MFNTTQSNNLVKQPPSEGTMAAISAPGSNPFVEFGKMIGVETSKRHSKEDFKNAQSVLANEMARLYPDGVVNSDSRIAVWTNKNLRHIVQHGEIKDANGNTTRVSDDVKAAAQTILDVGGGSLINPNGDPWVSEDDLRKAISNGISNNDYFSDAVKRLER
ncbi:hypothetical protein RY831_02530 [Noviherbaspirillum sp. CPCC 100848]|uniref:Uncharacterized protein n=1 Tax=Noviherbaspirillum album TaxID=3080276 RepID=A0ABU6J307_9BURK|nr:hypothetical protein [Noviherbaspirillum sp. CPCC 100848]MEC4718014.1 hypothetical protein [Noviherbaspirillum sp. CPCC 100848]